MTWELHCYKTEGEIPVHTHDDAGRQRSTTGKYFRYKSGVNTCFAPAVINTSGIFPWYYCMERSKMEAQGGIDPAILGTTGCCLFSEPLLYCTSWEKINIVLKKYFLHSYIICARKRKNQSFFLSFFPSFFLAFFLSFLLSFILSFFLSFFLSSFPFITTVNDQSQHFKMAKSFVWFFIG